MSPDALQGTTLLLGAGASVEAGVPASMGLTQELARRVDEMHGRYQGTSQALNIAIGALIAYDTARGGGAFDSVDVERLFSAVQMLGDRDKVEIAPFVANWSASLDAIGQSPGLPAFFKDRFTRELASPSSFGFERMFRDAVQGLAVDKDSGPIFRRLETQMVAALQTALHIEPSAVDYLAPLLNVAERPLRIATLNYDRSVEILAAREGASLDTGVDAWTGGFDWEWDPEADIRLLKLHGSIDWILGSERAGDGRLAEDKVRVAQDWNAENLVRGSLALVFGQRGKLRSNGPFLAMLHEFDSFLSSTEHLAVVGYSFRDDHINAVIRRWFDQRSQPRLTIIDPAIDASQRYNRSRTNFLQELLSAMFVAGLEAQLRPEHRIINSFTGDALVTLFGDRQLPPMPIGPTAGAEGAS